MHGSRLVLVALVIFIITVLMIVGVTFIWGNALPPAAATVAGCAWTSTAYTRNTTYGATASLKMIITRCGAQRRVIIVGNATLNATGGAIKFGAGAIPLADLPAFHTGDGIHKDSVNCWMQVSANAQIPQKMVFTIASDGSAAMSSTMVFNLASSMVGAGKDGCVSLLFCRLPGSSLSPGLYGTIIRTVLTVSSARIM